MKSKKEKRLDSLENLFIIETYNLSLLDKDTEEYVKKEALVYALSTAISEEKANKENNKTALICTAITAGITACATIAASVISAKANEKNVKMITEYEKEHVISTKAFSLLKK